MGDDQFPSREAEREAPALDEVRRQRFSVRTALDELEWTVSSPSAGRSKEWTADVIRQTTNLAERFAHHVEVTEQQGGLFDDVVTHAPRLSNEVGRLRDDHNVITAALASIINAERGKDPHQEVIEIRDAVLDVMGRIVRHRSVGSSLLYDAYFVDIDAAD